MNLNYKIIFVNFFVFVVLLFFCEIFLRIYFNNNLNYNVEMWKYANTLKNPVIILIYHLHIIQTNLEIL